MDFFEVIEQRYSVRAYKRDPIDEQVLRQVLEAARLAPTACNIQPFQLVVVQTAKRQHDLARLYHRAWFREAPLVIGIFALTDRAWARRDGVRYGWVDATIAMDHLILGATALGLGTCWVAAFDPAAAREIFRLPGNVQPVAFTPLGYPADAPPAKSRKPLEELVRYEHW
ncbi:MAG: nitroreductase family protein [Polyangiaceae bacterium]|nr:nitroreductase family protein [Polyangiaceae bacterium]